MKVTHFNGIFIDGGVSDCPASDLLLFHKFLIRYLKVTEG